jgi:hypothetical protein
VNQFEVKMRDEVSKALEFKRGLERDFEAATGLPGRSHYSAVYSLPQQSPVLWLNLNPGGTPETFKVLSDEQLASGRHEFWHGDGKTSKATGAFLAKVFEVPSMKLRSIQGTNIAWERSPQGRDIDLAASARRAAPFLDQYIRYVMPTTMMFGGVGAFNLFVQTFSGTRVKTCEKIMDNWGRNEACIFMSASLDIPKLGSFQAITVSHPSRGARAGVAERCRDALTDVELPKALV